MLRHGVPDSDLAGGREGDELRADEEEAVHDGPEVEGAHVHAPHAVLGEAHQAHMAVEGDCSGD